MITPYEIENKDFSRSVRGYNVVEVDDFLDLIILDLQKLLAENEEMKNTVKSLEDELRQYKRSESSVLNTLESAKKLMNDISESAEKRAEIIIRNARMDAEVLQRDAKDNISKLTEEGDKLKHKVARFRERYRQLLEEELSQLEGSSEELFADLEREFMPASMEKSAEASEIRGYAADLEKQNASDFTSVFPKNEDTTVRRPSKSDTMAVSEKSLDDMLMETFGAEKSAAQQRDTDLTKTRIVR